MSQPGRQLVNRYPRNFRDFVVVVGGREFAFSKAQQVMLDGLVHHVSLGAEPVFDATERGEYVGADSGFLRDLSYCGFFGPLANLDMALRQ